MKIFSTYLEVGPDATKFCIHLPFTLASDSPILSVIWPGGNYTIVKCEEQEEAEVRKHKTYKAAISNIGWLILKIEHAGSYRSNPPPPSKIDSCLDLCRREGRRLIEWEEGNIRNGTL